MKPSILALLTAVVAMAGCKQNQFNDYSGDDYLYFAAENTPSYQHGFSNYFQSGALKDSVKTYTFYYDDPSVVSAEVLFDLYATGGARDYDRRFSLRQIEEEGAVNAVAGVNYEAFDSDKMSGVYTLKAGQVHMRIPVVVKRSTGTGTYTLRFRIVENDNFKPGPDELIWRKVEYTSTLQCPDPWARYESTYYGKYSRTKHQWMIEETGFRWDNEFMADLEVDAIKYWVAKFKIMIDQINEERQLQGLGPWTDENGEEIAMGRNA